MNAISYPYLAIHYFLSFLSWLLNSKGKSHIHPHIQKATYLFTKKEQFTIEKLITIIKKIHIFLFLPQNH